MAENPWTATACSRGGDRFKGSAAADFTAIIHKDDDNSHSGHFKGVKGARRAAAVYRM
jgi:hypothetical protein